MEKTKKRKVKIGKLVYIVFMVVWAAVLCFGTYYLWSSVRTFAQYWEDAQVAPKVEAYKDKLNEQIWESGDKGVIKTISEMEHPYQTDEECVQVLKEIMAEDLRCLPGVRVNDQKRTYDLFSGHSKFGQVFVVQKAFEPDENPLVNLAIEKMSAYPWEVEEDSVQFFLDGLYTSFDITVPENYTVLVNGHPLTMDNVVESGIHYNVLEEYYEEFEGLPTKTRYHVEQIFGHVDYQLLDANGNPTEIDPEQDDSQFIEPVSQELFDRFDGFNTQFTKRYLEFCAGTGEMWYQYNILQHFVLKDSDLSSRLYRMIDSYTGWQHNYNYNFNGSTLNSVTALGNGIYVLDVSADAGSQMPAGYVKVHRDMKIYVKYFADKDEAFAFSVVDYNTEESDYIGG